MARTQQSLSGEADGGTESPLNERQKPRRFKVTNASNGEVLAECSGKVTDPVRRGVGLIGRRGLPASGGLIIQPCNSVVSFFMRFTIDVIFVNASMQIAYLLPGMVPWRVSKVVRGSKFVVELPAGTIERTETIVGQTLRIEPA